MDNGYHVISIPQYVFDKSLALCVFNKHGDAYNVAKTLSYYNHKTTQVIKCENGKCELINVFLDGYEKDWW